MVLEELFDEYDEVVIFTYIDKFTLLFENVCVPFFLSYIRLSALLYLASLFVLGIIVYI